MKNKDMFVSAKAQAWWALRERFHKTHAMIHNIADYPHDELISIGGNCPVRTELARELASPKIEYRNGKIAVESKAHLKKRGIPSPNLADAVVMLFAPAKKI